MSNWEHLKEKGNQEYKDKKYNAAINYYSDAIGKIICNITIIELNKEADVLYSNRALCYTAIKKFKKAIYDLEKAIDLNPKNIKAIKRLFNLHISLGHFGVSTKLINFYIKFNKLILL